MCKEKQCLPRTFTISLFSMPARSIAPRFVLVKKRYRQIIIKKAKHIRTSLYLGYIKIPKSRAPLRLGGGSKEKPIGPHIIMIIS
jgi:hypothetical protein